MEIYKTKAKKFPGTYFRIVHKQAFGLYIKISKKTKRRAYIRSAYFDKEKIFLDLFWHHLFEKPNWRNRVKRIQYYACALELIQNSSFKPNCARNPNNSQEMLYRFYGTTPNAEFFCVQIKETKKKKQKFLISIYPVKTEFFNSK